MKTIILDGGPAGPHPFWDRLRIALPPLLEQAGCQPTAFPLAELDIKPCCGRFHCWLKTPGLCQFTDDSTPLLAAMARAGLFVWLTPVTFGGYGFHLKKTLDRIIPILLPFFRTYEGETHHLQRYPVSRRLLVAGTTTGDDPESAAIFHQLVRRNALNLLTARQASLIFDETVDREEACAEQIQQALTRLEVAS